MKAIRKFSTAFLVIAAIVLSLICWMNSYLLSEKPFTSDVTFNGPSGVFHGESGNTYVIDSGRKEILILNEDMEYVRTIEGGSNAEGSFYYASAVTDGPDGIYVADASYAGKGTIIESERIIRYKPDGSGEGEILYDFDYPNEDAAPRQYGLIKKMKKVGDTLQIVVADNHRVRIFDYGLSDGSMKLHDYGFGELYIFSAAADPQTGDPAALTGNATILEGRKGKTPDVLLQAEEAVYGVEVTDDGTIWYSIPATGALMRIGEDGEEEFVTDEAGAYYISSYGNALYLSDGAGIATYENDTAFYTDTVPIANTLARNAMWILLILDGIILLYLVFAAGKYMVLSWLAFPFFRKIAIVVAIDIVGASAVGYYMLHTTFQKEDATIMAQMDAMSQQIVAATDPEIVKNIGTKTDYKTRPYNQLKRALDAKIEEGYARGEYFYYMLLTTDGEFFYPLMDYEDTGVAGNVYDVYGAEGYTEAFETGEPQLIEGEVSTWGTWTSLIRPVVDADGTVVAVQDVGFNFDNVRLAQQRTIVNTVLTIVFSAIVLVMVLIEIIYFTEHLSEKKKALARKDALPDITDMLPLRTLIFLAYTVDCMQDAFISILANDLYEPFLGLPKSVGAALPISGQVLSAAIFAVVGGFLCNHLGSHKVISLGFLLEASGFLVCSTLLTYFGIFVGKILAGAGIGLVAVGVNATAASSSDKTKSVDIFAGIAAGTLAGVSAGSGLGSTILSFGGYRVVFSIGVGILVVGLFLTVGGYPTRFNVRTVEEGDKVTKVVEDDDPDQKEKGIGIFSFLVGKGGVLPFLTMILLPFMAGYYFRDYFFPIFAAENGLSESDIGRIFVLGGLAVIYMGPPLTKYLEEHLGGLRIMLVASLGLAMASLAYGLAPNMVGAVIGVVLVTVSASVGNTAMSSYFSFLPKVSAFGEGRAMGIYSMFDNGGQTLGPIVYGYAMLMGYQVGMLAVGSLLMGLTLVFGFLNRKTLRIEKAQLAEKFKKEKGRNVATC